MHELHITLLSAAAATLIAIWLSARCGSVRGKEKIVHGDGGSPLLMRRMRAQANFVEYTPLALILIGLLEMGGLGGWTLGLSALAFLIGRVLHGIGMDSEEVSRPRMIGMVLTLPIMLGWAIAAVLVAFRAV
ncbi:MAPEG family protein [Alteraurantiacibacter aquimixticola]|uniref:MAPEG family protein n=1 Tax=Alteraurantiacibacter aquimixticola TaxID=2489173 RepID=A0A4T3F3M2_9SPHN|nr:MAPEG family protein [Alteraurantiacibacter aquimixticola]TIX51865.1 MAPEG family protein [Alteraurantiacibacter aquimixticola]